MIGFLVTVVSVAILVGLPVLGWRQQRPHGRAGAVTNVVAWLLVAVVVNTVWLGAVVLTGVV